MNHELFDYFWQVLKNDIPRSVVILFLQNFTSIKKTITALSCEFKSENIITLHNIQHVDRHLVLYSNTWKSLVRLNFQNK